MITLFGATEILSPTLMEDYAALRNLVVSGVVTKEDCLQLIEDLASCEDAGSDVSRVTLFGACCSESPTEELERRAIDSAERAQVITRETGDELSQLIGCPSGASAGMIARVALA